MNIGDRVLFSFIGLVSCTLPSCKSRTDDDNLKRVQLSTIRAEQLAKQKCESQSDKTNQNLCFLNEYGKALLSLKNDSDDISVIVETELKKRGITSFLPMSSYAIGPKLGGACFSTGSYPVEKETFWSDQIEPLRKQIEHVAEFLSQYHLDLNGMDPVVFAIKKVELCPITITSGKAMSFHGSTLTIGLPVKWTISKNYGWYSYMDLRKMWDHGDFFEKTYSIKNVVTDLFSGDETPVIWQIANPVGMARNTLRQTLRSKGDNLVQDLKKFSTIAKDTTPDNRFNSLKSVFKLNPSSEFVQSPFIPAVIEETNPKVKEIFNQGPAKQRSFLDEWQCLAEELRDSSILGNAAVGGLMESADSVHIKYDIKAAWVAVANFHDIQVDFLTAFSEHKNFIELPKQSSKDFNFEVNASGKVVVVTGDRVNVNAAVSILRYSLERSLHSESYFEAARNMKTVPAEFWCRKSK